MDIKEYQRLQYKIDVEITKVLKWHYSTAELIKSGLAGKGISSDWARRNFDKVCLEKYRRFIMCPELMPEHERKRAEELLGI